MSHSDPVAGTVTEDDWEAVGRQDRANLAGRERDHCVGFDFPLLPSGVPDYSVSMHLPSSRTAGSANTRQGFHGSC